MTSPSIDARVHFDTHPTHSSAVTATLTGTRQDLARGVLTAHGFEALDDHTLVMARIDREEPYWSEKTAQALTSEGVVTEISERLRAAIDAEWTWANYPMSWRTREEIREVSNDAQEIYDDIRHGRLLIHAHAQDDHTTVAVGTYLDSGTSVYLHGENHLRQIADTFDSPAQALLTFERVHSDAMRPGPAPMTGTERKAAEARTCLPPRAPATGTSRPETETVPAYAADPGDHDALLDNFLTEHSDWEKRRTWSDETTHAIHESQTLRIERDHEVQPRDTAWTVAAYETPVSDRMWHLTATGTTPYPVLQNLLNHLGDGDGWDTTIGSPVTDRNITTATEPLTDAGWKPMTDGRWIRWTNYSEDAGIQFDALAAQTPNSAVETWTIWAGPSIDHPTWTVHASPYTPASMIASLTAELAHGTGTRHQQHPRMRRQSPQFSKTPPVTAPTGSKPQAGRLR